MTSQGKFRTSYFGKMFALTASSVTLLAAASGALAGNTTYQYDTLGRVVKVTYPDAKQICYQYDAAGNRTQVKRQATGTCTPPTVTLTGSSLVAGVTSQSLASTDTQAVEAQAYAPTTEEAQSAASSSASDN